MKFYKIIFCFFSIVLFSSLSKIDFTSGVYTITGKVFLDNKLLNSDSMFFFRMPYFAICKTKIDANGDYKLTMNWIGACMSGGGMDRLKSHGEELYWQRTNELNADSITFRFRRRENKHDITILNPWRTAMELYHTSKQELIFPQDLHFKSKQKSP